MSKDWQQGTCGCMEDMEVCVDGWCCWPCLNFTNAKSLGKSGCFYTALGLLFMPCIPTMLLRQEARARYNIEGDTMSDVVMSVCCGPCTTCQTAVEIKSQGDEIKAAKMKEVSIVGKEPVSIVGLNLFEKKPEAEQ